MTNRSEIHEWLRLVERAADAHEALRTFSQEHFGKGETDVLPLRSELRRLEEAAQDADKALHAFASSHRDIF